VQDGHGVFNADPHPGNLLFQPDGRLVILDHGCVREFDRGTVAAIAELSRAVRRDDGGAVRRALVSLGAKDPGAGKAYEVTRGLLRGFYAPTLQPGARRVSSGVSRSAREVIELQLDTRLPPLKVKSTTRPDRTQEAGLRAQGALLDVQLTW